MAAQGEKARLQDAHTREHAITSKVLRAYPKGESEMRPHERSNSALQLAWTFVVEEMLMLKALNNEEVLGGGFPAPLESWDAVLKAFDTQHEQVMKKLEGASDAVMDGIVTFFTGPKQTGPYATGQFLWFLVCDQIHHRGQLSVYLRMAGGKVPSIYGPSADEPWA